MSIDTTNIPGADYRTETLYSWTMPEHNGTLQGARDHTCRRNWFHCS